MLKTILFLSLATTTAATQSTEDQQQEAQFLQKLAQIERADRICREFGKKDLLACVEYLMDDNK